MNEQELDGRRIRVNMANAKGGGGGGGGYGGGGYQSGCEYHPRLVFDFEC